MTVQITDRFLGDMRAEVFEVNTANGWFDEGRDVLDDIALLHSEVSEMFEAYRDGGFGDMTGKPACDCQVSTSGIKGMHHSTECAIFRSVKPLGFGSECADVLVRLLDTSHRQECEFSWESLAAVPDFDYFPVDHTVGGHISYLHWAIATIDLTEDSRALDRTLQYLTTWCRHLGIDLLGEFERKLAFNRTRGYKHGNKLL